MVAVKTNERPGTRAVARYVRVSASKAREVLDLIRGESYGRAAEIAAFSERAVSDVIAKCLDSAVANAENNDGISAEELYVSACYADEGPTLKRWRPRARGRATRINKRTCHITIIVNRYDEATLEDLRAREEARGRAGSSTHAAEARRQRVERSRAAAEEAAHDHEDGAEDAPVDEVVDDKATEAAADELVVDEATGDEVVEIDEATADEVVEAAADEPVVDEATGDEVVEIDEATADEVVEDAVDEPVADETTEGADADQSADDAQKEAN
ncbi:MAG: 50S ribosomal protein L22 [Actinomycetota bacterium]|nr:50S ribosomal protein L22 [Actinomycetota bacterium]